MAGLDELRLVPCATERSHQPVDTVARISITCSIPHWRSRFNTKSATCSATVLSSRVTKLGLVGDLSSTLMPARRFRVVVLVIQFVLEFSLPLGRLSGVLRLGRWIVDLFHAETSKNGNLSGVPGLESPDLNAAKRSINLAVFTPLF